jgi:DNA damage-binding protein 1
MKLPEMLDLPTIIFGTVNGVIGVIASLPAEEYSFFLKVQQTLTKVIKGVGGFKHEEYPLLR